MKISAIIPTRGDVPMGPILDRLQEFPEINEIIIRIGDTPAARYEAAMGVKNDVVYTQDDDCLTDLRPLIEEYKRLMVTTGKGLNRSVASIVNAMTPEHAAQYPGSQTLIGFGAVFHHELAGTSFNGYERDALFYRESDRIFATVNPHVTVFPRIDILPHATAANRLYRQSEHVACRMEMERRIFERTGIRA